LTFNGGNKFGLHPDLSVTISVNDFFLFNLLNFLSGKMHAAAKRACKTATFAEGSLQELIDRHMANDLIRTLWAFSPNLDSLPAIHDVFMGSIGSLESTTR
jgi:hypothetical protein